MRGLAAAIPREEMDHPGWPSDALFRFERETTR